MVVLQKLSLKITHLEMKLKDLRQLFKPIRKMNHLRELSVGLKITDKKHNMNLMKCFNQLSNLY